MPRYMVFAHAPADTGEMAADVEEDVPLAERNEQLIAELGLELVDLYYLTSKYWSVAVVEAPNNETVARAVRDIYGEDSTIKPEIVPAVTAEEVDQ